MITAFGNFGLDLDPSFCAEVTFEGGNSGGTATFVYCGATRFTTISIGAFQITFPYCIESNSLTVTGTVNANLQGPCSAGSSGGDGPVLTPEP